jgi:Icc-related predicted phosphoesterase
VPACLFVTDLHGNIPRYQKLFAAIVQARPAAVFLGGDLLPMAWGAHKRSAGQVQDFSNGILEKNFLKLRRILKGAYPRVFLILGNDDPRAEEAAVAEAATQGLWDYVHGRQVAFGEFTVFGYANVNPTPFLLKDWERYDVSRYVDPGAVSPEEGFRSVPRPEQETKFATIKEDLERLAAGNDLAKAIFLFHAPPYRTRLDLSVQGGKTIDHVPLDRHLGSIAIRRFIEARQPLLTLHGHVHESARLSGDWRDRIGRTTCFSAAHDGLELALIRFDPERLEAATRDLI